VDEGHVAGRPGILALVASVAMRIDRLDAFGFEPFLEQFEGCAVCFDDQHSSPYVRSCGHSAIPVTSLWPLGPRRLAPELRTPQTGLRLKHSRQSMTCASACAMTVSRVSKDMLAHAMEAAATFRPHVLALDDDPSIRALLTDYLGENDMRVTAVASGKALADALSEDAVDLILLDLRLPGEDGMQIMHGLRETTSVPILLLTGVAEEADRLMALELGADAFLTKPFSARELLARIRALLRRSRVQATVADRIAEVRAWRFGEWELNVGLRKLRA